MDYKLSDFPVYRSRGELKGFKISEIRKNKLKFILSGENGEEVLVSEKFIHDVGAEVGDYYIINVYGQEGVYPAEQMEEDYELQEKVVNAKQDQSIDSIRAYVSEEDKSKVFKYINDEPMTCPGCTIGLEKGMVGKYKEMSVGMGKSKPEPFFEFENTWQIELSWIEANPGLFENITSRQE